MSEREQARIEGSALAPLESGELQSIGSYLAAQRRMRGMSLDELAQLTRIPLRSLERLEAGSYDGVTDGFVRGFVRTVAEALGLEPDATVARMLREVAPGEDRVAPARPALRRALGGLALLALLALAAGVIRAVVSIPAPRIAETPEQVFRPDAVRRLADAQREATGIVRRQPPGRPLETAESGPSGSGGVNEPAAPPMQP